MLLSRFQTSTSSCPQSTIFCKQCSSQLQGFSKVPIFPSTPLEREGKCGSPLLHPPDARPHTPLRGSCPLEPCYVRLAKSPEVSWKLSTYTRIVATGYFMNNLSVLLRRIDSCG